MNQTDPSAFDPRDGQLIIISLGGIEGTTVSDTELSKFKNDLQQAMRTNRIVVTSLGVAVHVIDMSITNKMIIVGDEEDQGEQVADNATI